MSSLPLRLRLTLWYTASLALILCLFAAFVYFQARRGLLAQLDTGLDIVATQALISLRAEGDRLVFPDLSANPAVARRLGDDFLVIDLLAVDGRVWDRLGEAEIIALPDAPVAGYTTVMADGEPRRVLRRPVTAGAVAGWLQLAQDMDAVNEPLRAVRRQMALALPVALLAAALGGYWLAARALRPVDEITRLAQTIGAADLSRRIAHRGPADEIGRLAQTLDAMLTRLEAGFDRERRFTADAAHELRTPLAALRGRIEVTRSRPRSPAAYDAALAELEGQVNRLIGLSNDLLFMARLQADDWSLPRETISLADLLPVVVDGLRPAAEAKGIILTVEANDAVVEGDMGLLSRLLLNLLDNAIRHTPPGGRVMVSTANGPDGVTLSVSDTGPGIAAEHLPHLFERFYRVAGDRARADGGGAGLGLALAQEIARRHGGDLTVSSAPGRGATFTIRLPVCS